LAVYQVSSGDLDWEGEAESHDDAVLRAVQAHPTIRLGELIRVQTGKRGSSRWASASSVRDRASRVNRKPED
jgi:hypothetical protein